MVVANGYRLTATDPSAEDLAFCRELLPEVSRTFALSISVLPSRLKSAIEVSYLLCRIADTVEDDHRLTTAARERLFDAFFDELAAPRLCTFERLAAEHALGGNDAEKRLCADASRVFRCFHALGPAQRAAIRPHVAELADGMRQLGSTRHALADVAALERYCYFVAGTVGKLLTALFEDATPSLDDATRAKLRARAVSFGIGLQLVNIVKDVAEDWERRERFIPDELCARHGVPPDELLAPSRRPAAMRVVGDVCALARERLRHAREYTLLWPAREAADVRMFCAVPLALALLTLREVERGDDALRCGATPKVSRAVVARVLVEARQAVHSDDALRRMFDGLSSEGDGA